MLTPIEQEIEAKRDRQLAELAAEHNNPALAPGDPVASALAAALSARRAGADPRTLRRALRQALDLLDEAA